MSFLDEVKFNEQGLVPAVVQDAANGEVLMLAYMNRETLRETIEGERPVFWSRSRQSRWVKGETSGNTQRTVDVLYDCDVDTLVVRIKQHGPACHNNYRSCFYRRINRDGTTTVIAEKMAQSSDQ
ncbi:MAG: phosphoribosyl-AMP cyclohydrolase [Verrucomicrobia bacterium]|nr:phosphoribosyl-AMP cyclohydrolase [Verrucomicrobiota bacterium]